MTLNMNHVVSDWFMIDLGQIIHVFHRSVSFLFMKWLFYLICIHIIEESNVNDLWANEELY